MACLLFDMKPLSRLKMECFDLDLGTKFQWNSYQNTMILISENGFENITKYYLQEIALSVAASMC